MDTFTDDGLGRLRIIGGTHEWDTYSYDRNGNRLTSTQSAMTYNARGQLTDKVAGSCSTSYAYDLNGNQTSQTPTCSSVEQRTMEYNKGDQMTRSVTLRQVGGELLQEERTFWYDGLGRRILLLSEGHTASGQRAADYGMWRYFWFGDHVGVKTYNGIDSADADLWWPAMTRNAQGQLDGRGEWFFYAPGVDNLLASWNYYEVNPSPRHLFFRDWRGSVVKVTNEHGTALGLSPDTYAAFGAPGGTMTPDKERGPGYNGHESAGGLVYMRNRWYDPNTGRFTQEDPIGFAGGSNLYGYVGNNPVSFKDPFGLKQCPPDCDARHAVAATAGAIITGTVGAVLGAAGGTLAVPGVGTISGGGGLGAAGATVGAAGGVALVNLADRAVELGGAVVNELRIPAKVRKAIEIVGILVGLHKGEAPPKPPDPDPPKQEETEGGGSPPPGGGSGGGGGGT